MFGADNFRYTQTVIAVDVLGGDTFSGRFTLHRGDRVRGIRLCMYRHGMAANDVLSPSDITFWVKALNDPAALGSGIALPATSQLTLVDAISAPYTTSAAFATTTTPATGAVAAANLIQSVDITLPLCLLCDATTRDISFQVSSTNNPHTGFVSLDFEPAPDQTPGG